MNEISKTVVLTEVKQFIIYRGLFVALWKIYDGAFLEKRFNG